MAAKHRPAKCLYYYKGYCLRSKDEPVKKCTAVCNDYVHYDLDPKHRMATLKAFTAGNLDNEKGEKEDG